MLLEVPEKGRDQFYGALQVTSVQKGISSDTVHESSRFASGPLLSRIYKKMRWYGLIYPQPILQDQVKWLAGALQDSFGKHALIHAEIRPEQGRTRVYLAFVDQVKQGMPDPTTGTLSVRGLEPVDRHEFTEAQGLELEATLIGDKCKYNGNKKILCKFPCGVCWKKSFASSERAAFAVGWEPREEFLKSSKKLGFKCGTCKHPFPKFLNDVSKGSWCPYCCNMERCLDPLCGPCGEGSFASHPKAIYAVGDWPRKVALNSNVKQDFKCPTCLDQFQMSPNWVVGGTWCQKCRDTTEHKVGAFLKEAYGTRCKDQPKAPCPNGQVLKLDWRIEICPGIFVSIELDGGQHFGNCSYFRNSDLAVVRARDIYKMLFSLDRGDFIIRISQPDVYRLEPHPIY
jgi:hypothetical protein